MQDFVHQQYHHQSPITITIIVITVVLIIIIPIIIINTIIDITTVSVRTNTRARDCSIWLEQTSVCLGAVTCSCQQALCMPEKSETPPLPPPPRLSARRGFKTLGFRSCGATSEDCSMLKSTWEGRKQQNFTHMKPRTKGKPRQSHSEESYRKHGATLVMIKMFNFLNF